MSGIIFGQRSDTWYFLTYQHISWPELQRWPWHFLWIKYYKEYIYASKNCLSELCQTYSQTPHVLNFKLTRQQQRFFYLHWTWGEFDISEQKTLWWAVAKESEPNEWIPGNVSLHPAIKTSKKSSPQWRAEITSLVTVDFYLTWGCF